MNSPEPGGRPSGGHCFGARSPGKKWGDELGRRMEGSARDARDESSGTKPDLELPPRIPVVNARSPSPRHALQGPGPERAVALPYPLNANRGAKGVTRRSHGPLRNRTWSLVLFLPPSLDLASCPENQGGPVAPPAKAGLGGGHGGDFFFLFSFLQLSLVMVSTRAFQSSNRGLSTPGDSRSSPTRPSA